MQYITQNLGKIILGIGILVGLILLIRNFEKIKKFIFEVKAELTKVSWSTRRELMNSTAVVIGVTSIMALFIGIVDIALSKILSLLVK